METIEKTSDGQVISLMKRGRERLILALDQLQSGDDAKAASRLVGQASDELGRAIYHLRQLVRERGE